MVVRLLAIPMEPQSSVVNITPSSSGRNKQMPKQHTRDFEARFGKAGVSPALFL
eukprot:jgi/Botrbrau1/14024/Bobra.0310s0011.1